MESKSESENNHDFSIHEEVVDEGFGGRAVDSKQRIQRLRMGMAPPSQLIVSQESISGEHQHETTEDIFEDTPFDKESFILAVQTMPCLWNIKCKEYKNRNMKINSWAVLADTFKESGRFSCFVFGFVVLLWSGLRFGEPSHIPVS